MSGNYDPKVNGPLLHRVLDDIKRVHGEVEQTRYESGLDKARIFSSLEKNDHRLICYLDRAGIDDYDAVPVGSMLDAIGTCKNLDLMINSHGGVGEAAEKIVEMCRDHCTQQFRVIVPNYAKSAATMI